MTKQHSSQAVQTYVVAAAPGGKYRNESPDALWVSDGQTLHESVRSLGQHSSSPAPGGTFPLEPMLMNLGFLSLAEILEAESPRFLRRQTVVADGRRRDAVVMETTSSLGWKITFWIDAERALILRDETRMDFTGASGALLPPGLRTATMVVTDYVTLAFDGPVPDSVFAPSALAGRRVTSLDYTAPRRTLEGTSAPDFTLPDLTGIRWTLSARSGRVVVLYFRTLDAVAFQPGDDLQLLRSVAGFGVEPVVIAVIMSPDIIRDGMRRSGLTCPALLDESGTVAATYHALPGMFVVIGRDGRVTKCLVSPSHEQLSAALRDATMR
ncbi:MAG TPA: redoxin domain-containing protein [Candidatus Eisenbacteria bacterium]|nr:redoxin domain-containing protein [Candidatus Eisenbacteria bacterium]